MLYSYTAADGPKNTLTYLFPLESGGGTRGGTADEAAISKLDNKDGSYAMTGSGRLFISSGRIEQAFNFDEYWYGHNSNQDYTAGFSGNMFKARDKAIVDMINYVVLGGNGKLINQLVDGTQYWAQALCVAWSFPYIQGTAEMAPVLTFIVLSGFWTTPAGGSIPIF